MAFLDSFLLSCGGESPFYPVSIPYSCRFDSLRSCYLSRTPGVTGNRRTWSWSGWVKRAKLGTTQDIFSARQDASNQTRILFGSSDSLNFYSVNGGVEVFNKVTTRLFRDPASHFHLLVRVDTTSATAEDRVQVYINGVRETAFSTNTLGAQNSDLWVNHTVAHQVGAVAGGALLDAYLSEVYLIDGAAPTPASFGQFSAQNPNVWVPKTPAGLTYGTNGFHLAFGNAAALGTDTSGNGNNFTSSGLASTDQMADTPTCNYPTINPLRYQGSPYTAIITNGNLVVDNGNYNFATIAIPPTDKWYWEVTETAWATANWSIGIVDAAFSSILTHIEANNANVGAVWGLAADTAAGTLTLYKNNVSQGTIATGITFAEGKYFPASVAISGDKTTWNFGQRPFAYTPPTGHKALCSANLPDPAIIDSSKDFDAKAYTGTGAAANITSFNFQPDFAWIKSRGAARHHRLVDSVRGVTKELYSNDPSQEVTEAQGLTAFLTTGFSLGTSVGYNGNAEAYAAWCWKKIAKAGFDIVGYTGTGANRTVAHGLGAVPELIIIKDRTTGATHWPVYHAKANASPQNGGMYLCESSGFFSAAGFWNSTAPTSSVFSLGNNAGVNNNGDSYIAYLFRSVPGFSLLGSYTGNGNADGPFVYCGFRPRMVLLKRADADGYDWEILDAARDTFNVGNKLLAPDASSAENTSNANIIDFLSNGFKIRSTNGTWNTNTGTHIFAAFAEAPFKYANAR